MKLSFKIIIFILNMYYLPIFALSLVFIIMQEFSEFFKYTKLTIWLWTSLFAYLISVFLSITVAVIEKREGKNLWIFFAIGNVTIMLFFPFVFIYWVILGVKDAVDSYRYALKNRNSYSNINSRINRIKDTSKRSTALLLLNAKNDKKEDLDQIGKLVDDMINEERERK